MLKDFSGSYIALRRFPNGGPIGDGEDFVGPPMPYSLVTAGDIPLPDYNIFEDENSFKKRDAHLKSLDAFIAANPTIAGLNTADFRDVLSQFAGLESSYNPKASNKSGYSGYYGLEGGSALSDNAQHRKAYEHLASLFKHNITRDDVQKGIDMGYTPAQVLYKYWNQQNNATEFLQNGSAETIGDNPELELMGNNINAVADYYRYIPEAIMDDFHVVKSGDNFSTIQERVRKPGRHYNQAGKDLKQWNSDAVVSGKLKIGDKVWFTEPYADGGLLKDYRTGGKIHIKKKNRGKFTALKKRTGHSASWFKAHGTPAQKKMAVFALNARKWKHGDGGVIDRLYNHSGGDVGKMLELIQKARSA